MQENHTVENDSNSHESAYEDCSGESKDEIMQYEDSVSQPNAIDNATLQEQLYSSSDYGGQELAHKYMKLKRMMNILMKHCWKYKTENTH
eukprot:Em0001g3501a